MGRQVLARITVPGGTAFDLQDATILSGATLGEPATYYWAGDRFADYETAPAADLLQYVLCTMRYPVVLDGKIIGSISIWQDLDGSLKTAGLNSGDRFHSKVAAMREVLRPKDGERVSVLDLQAAGAGLYAVADDCEHILGLAPLEEDASRFVDAVVGNEPASSVVSLATMAEQIKANLRARREARERNR